MARPPILYSTIFRPERRWRVLIGALLLLGVFTKPGGGAAAAVSKDVNPQSAWEETTSTAAATVRRLKEDPAHKNDAHATSYAQRHPNRQYYSTRSNSPYSGEFASYYEDDDAIDDGFPRRYQRNRLGSTTTSLEDVILCMLTALAWTVWMISSAASTTQAARAAAIAGGILSQDEGGMDERFWHRAPDQGDEPLLVLYGNVLQVQQTEEEPPKYRSVVDYVIVSEHTKESLQIRKQFETSRALEVGFANVELLVLPEDPTHSCLKREYDEQLHNSDRILDDNLSDCKRLSTAFAAFLVLASLAGTVQVIYLMDAEDRYQGWIVLCVGVTLLLPLALLIHKIVKMIAAEPGGVIIGRKDVTIAGMQRAACLAPSCMETDLPEVASYVVPEASGCYFVHYEKPNTAAGGATTTTRCDSEAPYDNVSSASTISSISDNSPNTGRVLWNAGSSDSV